MNPLDVRRRLLGRNVYKKTVEGSPAIAQGSLARRYPGITMQGWTEQAQYEGNQLFDESLVAETSFISYIPVNVGDGDFTLSTDYIGNNSLCDIFFLPGNVESGASSNINGVKSGAHRTVTSVDGYVTVAMRKQNDDELNPGNYHIMLNAGSAVLPYEPYTGGQPSPNPDYPQEIVSAGKYDEGTGKWKYEVKLTGANLFDGTQFGQSGKVLHVDPTSGNRGITGIDYKPNTAYTISIEGYEIVTPNGDWTANFTVYYTDGTFDQKYTKFLVGNPLVTNKNKTIRRIVLANPWKVGETITGIMVNEGSTALPYEPYRLPQTATLTADRQLTKWDRLEKRSGVWGWVRKSAEIVLDGSEDWIAHSDFAGYQAPYLLSFKDTRRDGYSDSGYVGYYVDRFSIWIGVNNANLYVCFAPTYNAELEDRGIDNWKNFLSENPITILTYLDEETFVPLTEPEQEQMNALHTFRPTTVLSNDCECEMTLTYKTKKSLEVTT